MFNASDHNGLLDRLGTNQVSTTLGLQPVTVRAWRARNRIPAEHWQGIIALAASNDILITAEWLLSRMPKRATKDAA